MNEIWNNLIYMWSRMDWDTIWYWGWFLIILDIPRFVLLDGIVLFSSRISRKRTKDQWQAARDRLWKEQPLVSVIAPGFNEGKHYYKLVDSIARQTYQNIELIVVNDGSTDHSGMIGRSFERSGKIDTFISLKERGGKASAANVGLKFAKGEYIVHIDADSSLKEDAIEKILIPFFRYSNVGAVGGNIIVRNPEQSLAATMQYLEYFKSISTSRIVLSKLGIYKIISGAFGAFSRNAIMQVGGWDIGPGLDGDITVKIRKLHYRILFEEEAICLTNVPYRWRTLVKQRIRWSRSLVRFRFRKHKDVWIPDRNFNWRNFLSFLDSVLFAFILDFTWIFYMFKIIIEAPLFLLYWVPFKFAVYFLLNVVRFLYAVIWVENKKEVLSKVFYLPLYPIYIGYFMRIVRAIAYLDELFFYDSFRDQWNPHKTSREAFKHKM